MRALVALALVAALATPARADEPVYRSKRGRQYSAFLIANPSPGMCGLLPMRDRDARLEAWNGARCMLTYRLPLPFPEATVTGVQVISHQRSTWAARCGVALEEPTWRYLPEKVEVTVTIDGSPWSPPHTAELTQCRIQRVRVAFTSAP